MPTGICLQSPLRAGSRTAAALSGCSPDRPRLSPDGARPRARGDPGSARAAGPPSWPPTFHLEFRHDLGIAPDGITIDAESLWHASTSVFFEYARRFPVDDRLRLYTDTEGLSEEYERFSGLEFGVFPIPFRARLLSRRDRGRRAALHQLFRRRARREGFPLAARPDRRHDGRVRSGPARPLPDSGSLLHDRHNDPRCVRGARSTEELPGRGRSAVGLEGPLSPESYYRDSSPRPTWCSAPTTRWLSQPQLGHATEAIAAGIPTVVPTGPGYRGSSRRAAGDLHGPRTFIEAVRSICADYPITCLTPGRRPMDGPISIRPNACAGAAGRDLRGRVPAPVWSPEQRARREDACDACPSLLSAGATSSRSRPART